MRRKIIVKFVQWDLGPTESYPKLFSNAHYMHLTVTQERLACAGDNFLGSFFIFLRHFCCFSGLSLVLHLNIA